MDLFRKFVETGSRYLFIVSQAFLAAMVLLIFLNVLLRRTWIGGILGTYELTGYLGAVVIALSLGQNQLIRRNIAVDFVISHFPVRFRTVVESLNYLVSAFLYWTVAYCSLREGLSLWKRNEVSSTLSIPFLPVFSIIALGCFFLGLVLLTDFFQSMKEVPKE